MPAARILIVTNGPLCRNPRVVKEAGTLGRAGYDVTALTVRNHPPSEPADRALLEGAPFRRVTLDLYDTGETSRALVWLRRLRTKLARSAVHRFGWQSMAALGPSSALLRRARRIQADLTIVHNEVPHWVGTRLLASGRRVAADFEDWHSEDLLPADRVHRPLALLRHHEATLLHRAAYVSTTSNALADALHTRFGGRRPYVIDNAFPLQPDPRSGPPGTPPAFFWFSQTLGAGRGLEAFVAAWAHTTQPSRLVLLGEPAAGYADRLLGALPAAKRALVQLLPLVPPGELPAVIARHDIGLALEDASIVNRDLTITNKIIQYLNAGLAVVASDTAGQREVLAHAPGAGPLIRLTDTAALTRTLDTILADRAALARAQTAARAAAESHYCWERVAPTLLTAVETALRA